MRVTTACIKTLRACVLAAAQHGLSPPEVAARLGVPSETLADPHARVPHELVVRAWEELPALTGDTAFGLRAAELLDQAPFDVVDHVTAQGPTLRDAIHNLMRYQRLLHEDAEVRLSLEGATARMTQRLRAWPTTPRYLAEFIVALWVLRGRSLTGQTFVLQRVSFQHGPPADIAAHRRLFGAPLDFLADHNGVDFSAELLNLPVRGTNPFLAVLLERHAAEQIARLPSVDSVAVRVKALLFEHLSEGGPSVDEAARRLGMSRRSLQRALHAEGTSYASLLDEVRKELALAHLQMRDRTLSEIALLLGFQEVAAFTRAFRRWTGAPPSTFRRGLSEL